MKTFTYKTAKAAFLGLIVSMTTITVQAQEQLLPDQNPNYRNSMEKYMAEKDELLKNQGKTIQNTYKAIDDMELKAERKAQRKMFRQERRLARINNRSYYYNPYMNMSYNPYGYNYGMNYGYNNFGYNGGYYAPTMYNPYAIGLNTVTNTALLGLGLYWWLNH